MKSSKITLFKMKTIVVLFIEIKPTLLSKYLLYLPVELDK